MDKRKEHMLGIAGSFFDGLELKELKEEHEDDNCLNKFLDQEDCLVLFLTKDGNNISFQNNVTMSFICNYYYTQKNIKSFKYKKLYEMI